MRNLILVLPFLVLTLLSWGLFGPLVHQGQLDLGDGLSPGSLRPFLCVGIAYVLIALVVPALLLRVTGEQGRWTVMGSVWSLLGGTAGALGTLGMMLAFKFHGHPVYVMPLVFALAPVVTTLVGMWLTSTLWKAGPLFLAGVILITVGAAGVVTFPPMASDTGQETAGEAAHAAEGSGSAAANAAAGRSSSLVEKLILIPLSIAWAALCWGGYGPLMHRGQTRMQGSRLRPLLCVGLAYLFLAVVIPLPLLQFVQEPVGFRFAGTLWSLAGGAAGAIGAIGLLMAFTADGRPSSVMPWVFGGAPLVSTLATVWLDRPAAGLSPWFLAGLIVLIAGAATVLVFAPRRAEPASAASLPLEPVAKADQAAASWPAEADPDDCEHEEDTLESEETLL